MGAPKSQRIKNNQQHSFSGGSSVAGKGREDAEGKEFGQLEGCL